MLNSMKISVSKTCIQVYAVALFLLINLKDLQAASLCPEIQGCRCSKDSTSYGETDTADGTMKISCSSVTDPKLHLMPHENITQLILSRVTIANLSILDELRKTKLNKLSLYRNNFGETAVFTWKWIPDSITTISLSRNGFINFANGEEDCNFTRMKNNLTIHISDEKISLLSLCLPESTTKLSISNIQHSGKQETIEMTEWPRNMSILLMSRITLDHKHKHLFQSIPSTLKTMIFKEVNINNISWAEHFPSHQLTSLTLQNCRLRETSSVLIPLMKNAVNLKYLSLSRNQFKQLPSLLSTSIEQLIISYNEISNVDETVWKEFPNLKQLNLRHNRLSVVPVGMPSTLQNIDLGYNQIEYSLSSAFSSMYNLTSLDLSNNMLETLPEGITQGIQVLFLQNNRIYTVNNPQKYNFCKYCKIMALDNNPWICNVQTILMFSWLKMHEINTGYLSTRSQICKPQPGELDEHFIYETMEYLKYISKFNSNCSYTVDSLKCVNAGLNKAPDTLPAHLNKISITGNPNLSQFPDNLFYAQNKLKELFLDHNNLTNLPFGLPSQLVKLSMIGNRIGDFTQRDLATLNNLTSLQFLNIKNNRIKTLHAWQFEALPNLQWIELAENQLICDCNLLSFVTWYGKMAPRGTNQITMSYPTCSLPADVKGKDIRQLYGYYLYKLQCVPSECSWDGQSGLLDCSAEYQVTTKTILKSKPKANFHHAPVIPPSSQWTSLNLSGLKLNNSQIQYEHLTQLKTINLSDNDLTKIPVEGLPKSIKNVQMNGNPIANAPKTKNKSWMKLTSQQIIRKLKKKSMQLYQKRKQISNILKMVEKRLLSLQHRKNN